MKHALQWVLWLLVVSSSAWATEPLREKDLAIILPLRRDALISATDVASDGQTLLGSSWYRKVQSAYASTSVGSALEFENRLSDWKLVSARVVPCSPLGIAPSQDSESLCWPEVRLVWEPILFHFRATWGLVPTFADDRAIHALYDVAPELYLSAAEASRVSAMLSRVRSAATAWRGGPFAPLSAAEKADLAVLRKRVLSGLSAEVLALRGAGVSGSAYQSLGMRPDAFDAASQRALCSRLLSFFARVAPQVRLRELTSFSLPEGREPALIDEWVFLSFVGSAGTITATPIDIRSTVDGRVLFRFPQDAIASMTADDPRIEGARLSRMDLTELQQSVLLSSVNRSTLEPRMRDRKELHVPNTSCGSCHKFNASRFDFHNLSYLQDGSVTIAPRVVTDVQRDLDWLQRYFYATP